MASALYPGLLQTLSKVALSLPYGRTALPDLNDGNHFKQQAVELQLFRRQRSIRLIGCRPKCLVRNSAIKVLKDEDEIFELPYSVMFLADL
jgi:hypothetical protein